MIDAILRRLVEAIGGRHIAASNQPLRLEYRHIQALSAIGNRRVRIDPDGKVFSDVVTRDCPRGTHWSGPWPEQPVRVLSAREMNRLRTLIHRSGFFDLPESIEQAGHDGYREEIEVSLSDRRFAVAIQRSEPPPAFLEVRKTILTLVS